MKILFIPDTQAKPGDDFSFLRRIGQYIVDKKPEVIVHAGDFADMCSLSSYDKGKKSFEGRRYRADVKAAHEAMEALLGPLREYNLMRSENRKAPYRPRMVLTLGNHEDRINRAISNDPILDGTISADDLNYAGYGWEVHPFLTVVVIEGVAFSHYFQNWRNGSSCFVCPGAAEQEDDVVCRWPPTRQADRLGLSGRWQAHHLNHRRILLRARGRLSRASG